MSLLLDALKKSEAQRRRGTTPTIDLTRTPPSGRPRRTASRWLFVALAGVLLVAAAPWLWPRVSDWIEARRESAGESGPLAEVTNAAGAAAGPESAPPAEVQAEPVGAQAVPAPVAGAGSPRRLAAADGASPASAATGGGSDPDSDRTGSESGAGSGSEEPKTADAASSPAAETSMQELRRTMQARQQQARASQTEPEQRSEPERQQVNEPAENFIRPWELPQDRRAEFPALKLTVHFYAEREAERFVLINGERYREGQRVGPGTRLVEIRQRGAVVEFGSYRVLIE